MISAKLHYTDTGRPPATDVLYNNTNGQAHKNSTTNLPHRNAMSQHFDMSSCWDVANFFRYLYFATKAAPYTNTRNTGEFVAQQVAELLSASPLVVLYNMSVAGVRVVEFGTYPTRSDQTDWNRLGVVGAGSDFLSAPNA